MSDRLKKIRRLVEQDTTEMPIGIEVQETPRSSSFLSDVAAGVGDAFSGVSSMVRGGVEAVSDPVGTYNAMRNMDLSGLEAEDVGEAAGGLVGSMSAATVGGSVGTLFGGPVGGVLGAGLGSVVGGAAGSIAGASVGDSFSHDPHKNPVGHYVQEKGARLLGESIGSDLIIPGAGSIIKRMGKAISSISKIPTEAGRLSEISKMGDAGILAASGASTGTSRQARGLTTQAAKSNDVMKEALATTGLDKTIGKNLETLESLGDDIFLDDVDRVMKTNIQETRFKIKEVYPKIEEALSGAPLPPKDALEQTIAEWQQKYAENIHNYEPGGEQAEFKKKLDSFLNTKTSDILDSSGSPVVQKDSIYSQVPDLKSLLSRKTEINNKLANAGTFDVTKKVAGEQGQRSATATTLDQFFWEKEKELIDTIIEETLAVSSPEKLGDYRKFSRLYQGLKSFDNSQQVAYQKLVNMAKPAGGNRAMDNALGQRNRGVVGALAELARNSIGGASDLPKREDAIDLSQNFMKVSSGTEVAGPLNVGERVAGRAATVIPSVVEAAGTAVGLGGRIGGRGLLPVPVPPSIDYSQGIPRETQSFNTQSQMLLLSQLDSNNSIRPIVQDLITQYRHANDRKDIIKQRQLLTSILMQPGISRFFRPEEGVDGRILDPQEQKSKIDNIRSLVRSGRAPASLLGEQLSAFSDMSDGRIVPLRNVSKRDKLSQLEESEKVDYDY